MTYTVTWARRIGGVIFPGQHTGLTRDAAHALREQLLDKSAITHIEITEEAS